MFADLQRPDSSDPIQSNGSIHKHEILVYVMQRPPKPSNPSKPYVILF